MTERILVRKLDGTLEPFDESKLRFSLEKSGASSESIERIVRHIVNELREGMTTSDIYRHAFEVLKKKEKIPAARYSLKRAVMELGPTGFPFEKLVGEVLKIKGYNVTLGNTLNGACASHEIDVLAEKGNQLIIIEAKFHNELSVKSDLKVALYVKARYDDLIKSRFGGRLKEGALHSSWLITNTDFTTNAQKYGNCVGMKMIGWSHPRNNNLQDMIEETGLHPLTCLTSLTASEKNKILSSGNVLCRDVRADSSILKNLGVEGKKLEAVMEEIRNVCDNKAMMGEVG